MGDSVDGYEVPVHTVQVSGFYMAKNLVTKEVWDAARGGLSGKRFPWGDTITHSQSNYYSYSGYPYDVSPTRDCHPVWGTGAYPYTSPVGSFAPNGYGLYDMAGNLWEGCWDRYGGYTAGAQTDPCCRRDFSKIRKRHRCHLNSSRSLPTGREERKRS